MDEIFELLEQISRLSESLQKSGVDLDQRLVIQKDVVLVLRQIVEILSGDAESEEKQRLFAEFKPYYEQILAIGEDCVRRMAKATSAGNA